MSHTQRQGERRSLSRLCLCPRQLTKLDSPSEHDMPTCAPCYLSSRFPFSPSHLALVLLLVILRVRLGLRLRLRVCMVSGLSLSGGRHFIRETRPLTTLIVLGTFPDQAWRIIGSHKIVLASAGCRTRCAGILEACLGANPHPSF